MSETEPVTMEAELVEEDAARNIEKAVSARHSLARKYVMKIRRRNPDATPAEVIRTLEKHYGTSITTAGALITAGTIAADVGIALIPGVGAASAGIKSAGQQAAKKTAKTATKEAAKLAAKNLALGSAKSGAQRAAALLPAGDEQLQFELTAIFGLAIADIHGMDLDQDQAQALVFGLSNERVSQKQIALMASDVSQATAGGVTEIGSKIAAGRTDWSHWATTLADALPGGAAQSLVRTMQTGELDVVRENLSGKQQATVEYGVAAVTGGITRFVFGRDVIVAARAAFPEAPEEFPAHLAVILKAKPESEDSELASSKAFAALEDAAKSTGTWISDTAGKVGTGVAASASAVSSGVTTAAGSVSRPFRRVDLDGDGIPDAPQALTKMKGVGGTIAGKASSVRGGVSGLLKKKPSTNLVDSAEAEAKSE